MAKLLKNRLVLTLSLAVAPVLLATSQADARQVPSRHDDAAAELARHVRVLATNPRSFTSLINAGKAALGLGDAQAAAGFFGRAQEVQPNNPLVYAGMGEAVAVAGDPRSALDYFSRAERLGASRASIGSARGLAFDLLGDQASAQTHYRAALRDPDAHEARRRLALSLAIAGHRSAALETLQPLLDRSDSAARRTLVLVLAVVGDLTGARAAGGSSMARVWHRMEPFLERLNGLSAAQKAAAVNLGIFPPDHSPVMYASGGPHLDASFGPDWNADESVEPTRPIPGRMQYGAPMVAQGQASEVEARPVPGPMRYGAPPAPQRGERED